jgi:hypothetical protein
VLDSLLTFGLLSETTILSISAILAIYSAISANSEILISAEEILNESLSGSLVRSTRLRTRSKAYFRSLWIDRCASLLASLRSSARIAAKASLVLNNRECHSKRCDCQSRASRDRGSRTALRREGNESLADDTR